MVRRVTTNFIIDLTIPQTPNRNSGVIVCASASPVTGGVVPVVGEATSVHLCLWEFVFMFVIVVVLIFVVVVL